MQRLIIEMGMGVDLHGQDATKAAVRAVRDALGHSSLPILGRVDADKIKINVHIGVSVPEAVDTAAIAALLPKGSVTVDVVRGGLAVPNPDTHDVNLVANAAIEVFLPMGVR